MNRSPKELVQYGIEQGWIHRPYHAESDAYKKLIKDRTRMCMARLRAEQRGEDTSKFPPRVRGTQKLTNATGPAIEYEFMLKIFIHLLEGASKLFFDLSIPSGSRISAPCQSLPET